jgi:hypothetical protein
MATSKKIDAFCIGLLFSTFVIPFYRIVMIGIIILAITSAVYYFPIIALQNQAF